MTDNLTMFKDWCREAFQFLITDYGFKELDHIHPKHSNPYQFRFSNGIIELIIFGEGYGLVATTKFISPEGVEVSYQSLEPGWEPFKKHKRKKQIQSSQKDQIFHASEVIKSRDADILQGDYNRLIAVAERWQSISQKMGWSK